MKKWLGIEGVKLELLLPEEVEAAPGILQGRVRLESMNPHEVAAIRIVLIERYARGRKAERLIDEYELGRTELDQAFSILPGESRELPFTLEFAFIESNIDAFGKKNFLLKGLAKAAKAANQVSSDFRVEAEAQVKGVALNPFDKKTILIKH